MTMPLNLPLNRPWMPVAMEELASQVAEIPGPGSNPRIDEYLATVGLSNDATPWCSAFLNWVFAQCGIAGSGKAHARSWLDWGVPATIGEVGAVAVLWRGDPTSWQGHVGLIVDRTDLDVFLLGGNQKNRVSIAPFPVTQLLSIRLPFSSYR